MIQHTSYRGSTPDGYMTPRQAAHALRLDINYVYQLRSEGKLKASHDDKGYVIIEAASVKAYCTRSKTPPAGYLFVDAVAEALGVARSTVIQRCRRGLLPATKDPFGRWLVSVQAVAAERGKCLFAIPPR